MHAGGALRNVLNAHVIVLIKLGARKNHDAATALTWPPTTIMLLAHVTVLLELRTRKNAIRLFVSPVHAVFYKDEVTLHIENESATI